MSFENAYFVGSLRTGGAESAVRNVIMGMSTSARARVVLVLLSDCDSEIHTKSLGVSVYNLGATGVVDAAIRLRRLISALGIKRIHAHLAQCIIAAGIAVLGSSISLIPYIHTFGRWKSSPNFRGRLRLQLERLVCNHIAQQIVYVSEGIMTSHVVQLGYSRDKSIVISNPIVGPSEYVTYGPSCLLRIITVGRLEPVKGLDWVIEAPWFSDFFNENAWTIVGSGSQFAPLQSLIGSHSEVNVSMLGGRSDVAELLLQHDVFLLPSRSEGLSVAILEAMRAGLPIICTDVGSNREMVGDGINGFVISVGDREALKTALQKLSDPELRRSMGLQSRRIFHEKYDPVAVLNKLEGLLI